MARTIHDLLNDARACESAERASELLAEAFATAVPYELDAIVEAVEHVTALSDPAVAAVVDGVLARALEYRQYFCGFRIARVRATRLADLAGARAALEACTDHMTRDLDEPRGYVWVRLADELARLDDVDSAKRVLSIGVDRARARRRADDLVDLAIAWANRADRDAGLAMLREAETIDVEPASAWTLANAWHALDVPAEADRVLDTALANARVASAARHVLRAARSHGDDDRVRAALVRAEALAKTATEWLDLAEDAFDAELGVDVIRRALERAEQLAPDELELDLIANGYRVWLLDSTTAARFGERDQLPADRYAVQRAFDEQTSASGLLDWFRAHLTPEMVEQIAGADPFSYAKHLAALQQIVRTGRLPRVFGWEPHEAVALTRWSDGVHVDHVIRGFACTLLCIVEPDELPTNGPILLESCLALGNEVTELCAQLFAWSCEIVEPRLHSTALLLFVLARADAPDLEGPATRLLGIDLAELQDVFTTLRGELWRTLIAQRLVPLRTSNPAIDHFLAQLLP